jgi:hypothetical protein
MFAMCDAYKIVAYKIYMIQDGHLRALPVYGRREVYRGRVFRGFLVSQYPMIRVPHTWVHAPVDTRP